MKILTNAPIQIFRKTQNQNANSNVSNQVSTCSVEKHSIPINPKLMQIYFAGSTSNAINSSRKFVDYGKDVFVREAKLAGREFPKAKKLFVDLIGADIKGTNFSKSSFRAGSFAKADASGTNFEGANLFEGDFKNIITGVHPVKNKIGLLVPEGTNFMHSNLEHADFKGVQFGPQTTMHGANVMGADFTDADVSNLNLVRALYNDQTKFPEGFDPTSQRMIKICEGADLSGMEKRLERIKIRHHDGLKDIKFDRSSLKRADLKACQITDCSMIDTDLTRVHARQTIFQNVDLTSAKMKQINLLGAELTDVNMQNADLRGSILVLKKAENVNLKGARYDQYTQFRHPDPNKANEYVIIDPDKYGMIKEHSHPGVYGKKA